MRVTETAIRLYNNPNSDIVAFADVILDDELKIQGILVVKRFDDRVGKDRCRITLPFTTLKNGKRRDVAHPIKRELFDEIYNEVVGHYEDVASGKDTGVLISTEEA